jgi:hypothetical protein
MIKRFALIGTFTLVLAAVALPVYAQTHVSIGIGAPFYPPVAVVSAAPYSGYVWQPAHYVWTAFGYQFVPAEWVPAPYVVHRRAYVAPPVWGAPYDAPYYAPYASHGLSFGLGFNVGHGYHVGHGYQVGHGYRVGHGGHYGRHR